MQHLPQGTLFLWPDHWQVIGRLMSNRLHKHISASWLVGLDGDFRLQVDGRWRTTSAALVAPDVAQSLEPGNTHMWCAQLDPDSRYWRALKHHLKDECTADIRVPKACLPAIEEGSCGGIEQAMMTAVEALGRPPERLDPRVQKICDQLRAELPEKVEVQLLADSVGLSSSRLSHLFRQQTGVPLRRFLLHLKMNRVLAHWEAGKSMSRLALEAGFYDQPHFVRTAREMFDALPSEYVTTGWFSVCRCASSCP
ncbi:helix-turn-helix transcriptional regulator [Marinobacter sediminum]|uniref:AraC family transcriptional regulator n=1 Tax=Marinobacter sediminum TaxID=256323 RepID=UPI002030D512|nr:AraC family transcriptional regulator [Marinobacter sediminum]MCM0611101.1 helix-turn-helix transcriptional regulator [Marinobacter sediminum]